MSLEGKTMDQLNGLTMAEMEAIAGLPPWPTECRCGLCVECTDDTLHRAAWAEAYARYAEAYARYCEAYARYCQAYGGSGVVKDHDPDA